MIARLVTVAVFLTSGILHFARPKMYTAIMPDYLPAHRELVLVSGGAEIAGALGVLLRPTRRLAGWGLLALLVAVFPANLNMALNPERFRKIPQALLWARLPLQLAFGRLVWAATLKR